MTLLVFASSCALLNGKPRVIAADRTRQFVLHIDERFSPADGAVVARSFAEWERVTHGIVSFVGSPTKWDSTRDAREYAALDDDGCTLDVFVSSIDSTHQSIRDFERKPGGGKKGNTLGYTLGQCDEKLIALVMDRIHAISDPEALRFVSVHEAGHLVGLAHIPVPQESIMYPSMDKGAKCVTKLDVKQFCSLYGCDWHDMLTCD
jgi:hypothetical protein